MKNNVIWVDFTSKNKNKQKKVQANIFERIKNFFKFSGKHRHSHKPGDKYHKSIL